MSWAPEPTAFVRDLEAKSAALRSLAGALADDPWRQVRDDARLIVVLGMGSSRFSGLPVAARLRARGLDAVAAYASAPFAHSGGHGTLAIGVSASGATPETVGALTRHAQAGSTTVAITNVAASPLERAAAMHLPMLAGAETGGVACRSFQHTLALVLALVEPRRAVAAPAATADASEDLLEHRDRWLPDARGARLGDGCRVPVASRRAAQFGRTGRPDAARGPACARRRVRLAPR